MREVRRARYGIFDLFLLLLFLLSLLGLGVRLYDRGRDTREPMESYLVQGEIRALSPETADCIFEGATLYTAAGEVAGTLRSVRRIPTSEWLLSAGEYHLATWDERERVTLQLELALFGVERDGLLYLLLLEPLPVGESFTLYTDTAELHLTMANVTQN